MGKNGMGKGHGQHRWWFLYNTNSVVSGVRRTSVFVPIQLLYAFTARTVSHFAYQCG